MVRWAAPALLMLVVAAALFLFVDRGGPASPGPEVKVILVAGPGRVLADSTGEALFIYQPDDRGPSRCVTACATAWPPLLLPAGDRYPVAGRGVDPSLLGTTRRHDGSLQVTYNRWPLYLDRDYTQGPRTGQGDGMGAWYLISPDGSVDRQPIDEASDVGA